MPKYTFRVQRDQALTCEVIASDRESAWQAAACGQYEAEFPGESHDTILECTTPRRGRPKRTSLEEAELRGEAN